MLEPAYDRINEYDSVSIRMASPQDIRSWSYGEVKKPETINYRTYRSEKDGLFCERIFGPERDWECFCGKYKGIKHRGITCSRCGVTVTHSRVRRKRMGHITLAAPVVHIWFFKSLPCRIGILLGVKVTHLERVVYYQDYIVTDPGDTPLQHRQLLNEDDYQTAINEYGEGSFKADMGAEAVRTLLKQVNLEELSAELKVAYTETNSKQKKKDIIKRLAIVDDLKNSGNKPDWMVLEVIPVIPPDLRPLVLLESGNFATSDLNDLYRRLINRNNRLKKLVELNAPEVIIRNEKRMLQQSVDALFDNNRCRRPVLGSNSRPLRSLTDMIKGKQGRFRENLLGKRVDYSARSVIVVGPELKLHQCGLPKKIALELYQPFIIRRLKELGYADTIRSAKKMLERKDEEVWDILEDVIREHPVMLNRAPTLHRMGIQAFQPVLVEGNAIKIHPLVCSGFNADFDGDQMAVHLPLSLEAQVEAKMLMMSINNIFSPSHGGPIIAPSQDMVLGCHYLTIESSGEIGEGMRFASPMEVMTAFSAGKVGLHAPIHVRMPEGRIVKGERDFQTSPNNTYLTTAGRVKFNDILPEGMYFYNYTLGKKDMQTITADCHQILGLEETLKLLDDMKDLGFKEATLGGLSFTSSDLRPSPDKPKILEKTSNEVARIEKAYQKGVITEGERYNQIIDRWVHATEEVGEDMLKQLAEDTRDGKQYLNPIHLMVRSGARGSMQQVRQLAGMRGLMAKPSGKIIETPIRANFREGLRVCEYFSSTHGARKGLADTALKTADSGYLTRKLADVAQNVVVYENDCGTLNGITKGAVRRGEKTEVTLAQAIRGRVARHSIIDITTDEVIVEENQLITTEIAEKIQAYLGEDSKIVVRSALTCESSTGICAKCYGMDLSTGHLAEEGLAVGIIAAQSIGEPGTQLTMRTFHIGGVAFRGIEEGKVIARHSGHISFKNINTVNDPEGRTVILNKNARIDILDAKGRPRDMEGYAPPIGSVLKVKEGQKVESRQIIAFWDPHMVPILSEKKGVISFDDIVLDETVKEKLDTVTGIKRLVIIEHKGNLHPQIVLKNPKDDKILAVYPIPEKAHVEVVEGQKITEGTMLAKTPREITGTQDITGGLPRVTELFEIRKPKSPAIMSEIDGVIELGEKHRGKRTIIIRNESGMTHEHLIPSGKHMRVHSGDYVESGDALVEGALVPQDILRIKGEEAVQQYLMREIQGVYRSQNVPIDDKHVEIIISQMMRRVQIENPGDTDFLPQSIVDKFIFREKNKAVLKEKKKPATAMPLLMGITKSALQSESFISAASFQETTKVLTGAALAGRVDTLKGLKENVILGHMIPAGTGFNRYRAMRVKRDLLSVVSTESDSEIEEESKAFN